MALNIYTTPIHQSKILKRDLDLICKLSTNLAYSKAGTGLHYRYISLHKRVGVFSPRNIESGVKFIVRQVILIESSDCDEGTE